MGINTVLAIGGALTVGWLAIPVATSIAAWINSVWLWLLLRQRGYAMDDRLARRLPRLAGASIVMGVALWFGAGAVAASFESGLLRVPLLLALVGGGMGVYALAARALGAFTVAELKAGLRRT
jgi:putative peptidoglycan lipid II flippase